MQKHLLFTAVSLSQQQKVRIKPCWSSNRWRPEMFLENECDRAMQSGMRRRVSRKNSCRGMSQRTSLDRLIDDWPNLIPDSGHFPDYDNDIWREARDECGDPC